VNDLPVSVEYRWLLLFQDYVAVGFSFVLISAVLAAGFFVLAGIAHHAGVKAVAYFCAGGFGWGAVMTAINNVSWIVYLRRVLRQAKTG
jgi:hypothetical protein